MAAAALVAGCPNSPLPTAGKRPPVAAKPSPSGVGGDLKPIPPGALPDPAPASSAAPPLAAAATLSGVVRAPAGLIANNGGNIVSNGGGNIVSNGGNQYRTLALTQTPLAGATVALLDAQLQPIPGPDGAPIVAKADELGRFGFTGALPTHNVLLEVKLPEEKGTLMAIVPKDATGPRVVDLELIGTLSTRYILDQYVKNQLDPQGTLDKLPGAVERDTRLKAATAFEGSQAAVPEALTDERVLATVATMRQKDTAFNDQMEVVKRLLIAAGQSDLGNGRRATEVAIGNVSALALGPDGDLYFPTPSSNRVWRLTPDGFLHAYLGNGGQRNLTKDFDGISGKTVSEALIGLPNGLAFDSEGRLLLADYGFFGWRVSRLEKDGRFKVLTDDGNQTILPGPNDTVLTGDQFERIAGRDAQGRIYYVKWADAKNGSITRKDPATGQSETVLARDNTLTAFYVTQDAAIVTLRGGKLELTEQDGRQEVLLDDPAAVTAVGLNYLSSAIRAADGTLYLASNGRRATVPRDGVWTAEKTPRMIWRLKDGKLSTIAGRTGAGLVGVSADDLALDSPKGLTVDSAGHMYIADYVHEAVYKISPAGQVAAVIDLDTPLLMQADGVGNVYVLREAGYHRTGNFQKREVVKIAPDGAKRVVATSTESLYLYDFEVAPDGTIYLLGADAEEEMVTLYRQEAGAPTVLSTVHEAEGVKLDFPMQGLALAPDGTLWIGACGADHLKDGRVFRWTQAEGLTLVKSGVKLAFSLNSGENKGFSVDASGRVLWGETANVVRFDPKTGTTDLLAGQDGRYFNGTTVDDSVGACAQPTFNAAGDLIFIDWAHKQVKRIPKDKL